jgi:predicted RNA-binding protein YlxR (DUF448 family)
MHICIYTCVPTYMACEKSEVLRLVSSFGAHYFPDVGRSHN